MRHCSKILEWEEGEPESEHGGEESYLYMEAPEYLYMPTLCLRMEELEEQDEAESLRKELEHEQNSSVRGEVLGALGTSFDPTFFEALGTSWGNLEEFHHLIRPSPRGVSVINHRTLSDQPPDSVPVRRCLLQVTSKLHRRGDISVRWIHSIVEAATATRSRRCRNASFPAGVES